jgi:hypothetical protein
VQCGHDDTIPFVLQRSLVLGGHRGVESQRKNDRRLPGEWLVLGYVGYRMHRVVLSIDEQGLTSSQYMSTQRLWIVC